MEEWREKKSTWKDGKGYGVEGAQAAFAGFVEYQSHVN